MAAMAGEASRNSCLEQILSAQAPVVLLRGPAACGKTSAVLALYRHHKGRCLVLAPNAVAAAAMRSAVLAASPTGVAVRPMVMTFAGLVGRILAGAPAAHGVLSPFRRHLLLRQIADDLNAAGAISSLAAVADTPGLVTALDRAIAELKRAAVEPDALARAVGAARGKSADLVAVYKRYQQHLHASQTYDPEGLTWLARDLLAQWPGPGLPAGLSDVQAVAADGFTDFTPTEMDLLVHLSRLLPRVVITLPYSDDGRTRLWHWTARTAHNIRRVFGARLTEIGLTRDQTAGPRTKTSPAPPPLAALWDRVFDFDAPSCKLPAGLSLIAASGTEAEVAAAARRIKRLLVEGAPAGSIVVLARSLDIYRAAIERIFAAYRIPIRHTGKPLRESPIVRFALDVAELQPQLGYRQVLRVIRSSYFRPQALGPFDAGTVAAAEAVIRWGNVVSGKNAYAQAARRLAARLDRGREGLDEDDNRLPRETPQQVRQAAEMLEALFALSQAASKKAGDGLAMIVERLQLREAACDHDDANLVAADLRALAALEAALRELPRPAPPLAQIEQALGAVTCPPAATESAVDVLDVLDARALRYTHVFCLGLTEGQFPQKFTDGSLIGERDRRDWAARGVALDTRDDLVAREMMLWYLAASRADAALTLSFLASDAAGRPAAPSSFLLSLLDPAGKMKAAEAAGIVETIGPGQFLPPADAIASDDEAATAAVVGLFDRDTDPAGAALAWAAAHAPRRLAATAAGLLARHHRWSRGPCDAYDGRISDADLLAHLADRFGPQAVFSASQLNAFGLCPWQFFASYVLGLQPLEPPTDRLTPLDRGLFCHRVLFRLFSQLAKESGEGFRLASADRSRLTELLDEAVAKESAAVESRDPAYPALWQVQRQQMHDDLSAYLRSQLDSAAELDARCLHFELGFGLGGAPTAGMDPASKAEPVAIDTPAGPIHLHGKIDRIDRVRLADLDGLLVIDYKTGRLPGKSDIDNGRALQLALYSAATKKLFRQSSLGGAFHQVGGETKQTYLAALKRWKEEFRPDEGFEQRQQAAIDLVGQFVQAIRGGRFDSLPTHDCPAYCSFRRICHYAKPRAALKADLGELGRAEPSREGTP
jgi:ATP-dependent helicase/DNAse subunit B